MLTCTQVTCRYALHLHDAFASVLRLALNSVLSLHINPEPPESRATHSLPLSLPFFLLSFLFLFPFIEDKLTNIIVYT